MWLGIGTCDEKGSADALACLLAYLLAIAHRRPLRHIEDAVQLTISQRCAAFVRMYEHISPDFDFTSQQHPTPAITTRHQLCQISRAVVDESFDRTVMR